MLDHHDATLLSWDVPLQHLCDIGAVTVRFLCNLTETHLALINQSPIIMYVIDMLMDMHQLSPYY